MTHDPLCPNCGHSDPHTAGGIGVCLASECGCEDMTHDPLCPNAKGCSHDCGGCSCNLGAFCNCDLIAKVRSDEAPKAVTRWIEEGAAADYWMKVWQVRQYAEELEAKVRADTVDRIAGHVQHGYHCSCGAEVNNFRLHLLDVTQGHP